MREDLAADVARVLTVLHDANAWFRHGLTDQRIAELAGLTVDRTVAARIEAEAQGLVERQRRETEQPITLLTPTGVARVRPPRPVEEEPAKASKAS